jgi:hypothetical protein
MSIEFWLVLIYLVVPLSLPSEDSRCFELSTVVCFIRDCSLRTPIFSIDKDSFKYKISFCFGVICFPFPEVEDYFSVPFLLLMFFLKEKQT